MSGELRRIIVEGRTTLVESNFCHSFRHLLSQVSVARFDVGVDAAVVQIFMHGLPRIGC